MVLTYLVVRLGGAAGVKGEAPAQLHERLPGRWPCHVGHHQLSHHTLMYGEVEIAEDGEALTQAEYLASAVPHLHQVGERIRRVAQFDWPRVVAGEVLLGEHGRDEGAQRGNHVKQCLLRGDENTVFLLRLVHDLRPPQQCRRRTLEGNLKYTQFLVHTVSHFTHVGAQLPNALLDSLAYHRDIGQLLQPLDFLVLFLYLGGVAHLGTEKVHL
ncbi:hypothetical protein AGDE_15650 [Angomonas deanei]|nr:hypothetical protein AGDE_15650 [Angomonas deanei]|eukprot:EPY18709.1 hypothetical protein AGDE_15650 [Angomonas deanei]